MSLHLIIADVNTLAVAFQVGSSWKAECLQTVLEVAAACTRDSARAASEAGSS